MYKISDCREYSCASRSHVFVKKTFEIWPRYNSLKLVTEQFLVVLNKFFLGTSYYNFFQLYLIWINSCVARLVVTFTPWTVTDKTKRQTNEKTDRQIDWDYDSRYSSSFSPSPIHSLLANRGEQLITDWSKLVPRRA